MRVQWTHARWIVVIGAILMSLASWSTPAGAAQSTSTLSVQVTGTYTCQGNCASASTYYAKGTAGSYNWTATAHLSGSADAQGCVNQSSTWTFTSGQTTLSFATTSDRTCPSSNASVYEDKSALGITGGTGQFSGASGSGSGDLFEDTYKQTVNGNITLTVTTSSQNATTKTTAWDFPVQGTYSCSVSVCVLSTTYTASGTADTGGSGVYKFTAAVTQTAPPNAQGCIPQKETWTLTHGQDQLAAATTSDTSCQSSDPVVFEDVGVLKVSSGQGQFDGATGGGSLDVAQDVSSQTVKGTLKLNVTTPVPATTAPASAHTPVRRPSWQLTVTPRVARPLQHSEHRARFTFSLTEVLAAVRKPYSGATIRFDGRSARTSRSGRATITVRGLRQGTYLARAVVNGRQVAVARVRARA